MKTFQQVSIRRAEPADAGQLSALAARAFEETYAADNRPEDMAAYLQQHFTPERQAAELAEPDSTYLLAEVEGEAVGYARLLAGGLPDCLTGAGHGIELARLYVLVAWQGRGVGAALMESCLALARAQSGVLLWLAVWKRNHRALAFYRRWQFREVGEKTFQLGEDLQEDFVMVRPLL